MKLVEILAREMDEWPGLATAARQYGRTVRFYDDGCGMGLANFSEAATDQDTAIVTRAMWEAGRDRIKYASRPRWSGEGLPPVGALVDAIMYGDRYIAESYIAEVLSVKGHMVTCRAPGIEDVIHVAGLRPIYRNDEGAQDERIAATRMDIITESACGEHQYRTPCTVIGEYEGRMVIVEDGENKPRFVDRECLHPHMTEEQLAAEERDKAIAEMMEAAEGSATRAALELLYDAGYRRQ